MKKVIITFPGNETLSKLICHGLNGVEGEIIVRHFPDGETYIKLITDVSDKEVIVVATLVKPDDKILALLFLLRLLKEAEASKIILVSPYLAYMRQDKQFSPGEAVTSTYFGELLSPYIDQLITVDPHLHRRKSMSEIYKAPSKILHAAKPISLWIKKSVMNPVIIGPDAESEQWVSEVAAQAASPYIILNKQRHGDRNVEISTPSMKEFKNHTPVLVDDIISTAHTMIEIVKKTNNLGLKAPVCIGVHAVFADQSYNELIMAGVQQVITSNTISHQSNGINISQLIVESLRND